MREEYSKCEGDLLISDEVAIHGIVTGSITVRDFGSLTLHGACVGNLEVEAGAIALIEGIVGGNVFNHGGHITINRLITGSVTCKEGKTDVGKDARVLGRIEGKIILTCQECSQKLNVRVQNSNLKVTCPNCQASWIWTPTEPQGTERAKKQNFSDEFFQNFDGLFRSFDGIFQNLDKVFQNVDMSVHQSQRASPRRNFLRKMPIFLWKIGITAFVLGVFMLIAGLTFRDVLGGHFLLMAVILCFGGLALSTFISLMKMWRE